MDLHSGKVFLQTPDKSEALCPQRLYSHSGGRFMYLPIQHLPGTFDACCF